MSTSAIPERRLRPGDPAPWFMAPTHSNPRFSFDTMAGRFVVVSFVGRAESPAGRALRDFLARHRDRFDDANVAIFGVTGDPTDLTEKRLVEQVPGVRWFADADGDIARQFKAARGDDPTDVYPQTIVLDPALRTLVWASLAEPDQHARALLAVLDRLPRIAEDRWSPGVAPVLILPRVFEPAFCRRLIDYYEANGGFASGHMTSRDGKSVGVLDRSRKRRTDCMITDEPLKDGIQGRLYHRLIPMIQRAFQFNATRIERYIVARYDGADRGFFFPHRDNTSPATKHRRFAVTINLNAEEYEGGDLRFPEFGRRTYRAPTGGAVVFSCSLTHEALPVTRGVRYATLPFLYDEAAAEIRAATRHLVVPVPNEGEDQPIAAEE
ncbi:2OG-Fe(II) oxygenase [Stella sp.]|uniref:2OG-Fe(II) oxygenase n=1 Tax=Stella sp. TaxID=2912054 RepID=UPI0035B16E65